MRKLHDDRAYWNQRYSEGSHSWREPDPLLLEACEQFITPLFSAPGRALDVAGGVGRHALWLAQRGWKVTLVDVSEVGLKQSEITCRRAGVTCAEVDTVVPPDASARRNRGRASRGGVSASAGRRSLGSIELIAADLGEKELPRGPYDLILVFFYLQRSLFPSLKAALKPGGLLIYKTYTLAHRRFGRGPSHPMYYLKPNELLRAFSSFQVLHYREVIKDRGVAELVARKRS